MYVFMFEWTKKYAINVAFNLWMNILNANFDLGNVCIAVYDIHTYIQTYVDWHKKKFLFGFCMQTEFKKCIFLGSFAPLHLVFRLISQIRDRLRGDLGTTLSLFTSYLYRIVVFLCISYKVANTVWCYCFFFDSFAVKSDWSYHSIIGNCRKYLTALPTDYSLIQSTTCDCCLFNTKARAMDFLGLILQYCTPDKQFLYA